jgi:hypothetical protein
MQMRALILVSLACCAVAASAVADRISEAINWAFRFVFAAAPAAPALAFAGAPMIDPISPRTFADPHVLRHEAGQRRRAAARGI